MAHIERSVLSIHMWVLEIKPVLTGLVANTLTQWAISLLAPILYLQRDEAISSEFQTGLTSTERTQQQNPKHAPYGYTKHCINPHNFLPTVISVSKTTLTYLLSRGLFFVSTLQFAVIHKPPSQKAWRHWTHRAVRSQRAATACMSDACGSYISELSGRWQLQLFTESSFLPL